MWVEWIEREREGAREGNTESGEYGFRAVCVFFTKLCAAFKHRDQTALLSCSQTTVDEEAEVSLKGLQSVIHQTPQPLSFIPSLFSQFFFSFTDISLTGQLSGSK